MEEKFLSVSHLNSELHKHMSKGLFNNILVKGELSDIFTSKKGLSYFKLKDEKSSIDCKVYPRVLKKSIELKKGLSVEIKGSVEVYKPQGKCQIKVNSIKEEGQGELFEKLQRLTKKLEGEGLFNDDHKKEIPRIPKRIGLITSRTGAAIKDIKTTIERRWPYCNIFVFSSLVQGPEAPKKLIKQLKRADSFDFDLLIIGRGGGSIEDLWAFNDEQLARAVYSCKTPIISAIGHERDTTLVDFVADKRAPTPTAAAELAVPDIAEIESKYLNLKTRLENSLNRNLSENRQRLDFILRSKAIRNPSSIYKNKKIRFESSVYRIKTSSNKIHESKRNRLDNLTKSFRYYSETLENTKRTELERLITRFNYSSEKYQNVKRTELERLTTKFDYTSKQYQNSKRKDLEDLVKNFQHQSKNMLTSKRNNMERLTTKFDYTSKQYQNSKRKDLEDLVKNFQHQSKNMLTSKRNNMERLTTKFDYTSKKYVSAKRMETDLLKRDFKSVSNNLIFTKKTELNSIKHSRILKNPKKILDPKMQQYQRMYEKVEVVNPLNSLKRGYTIAKKDNKTITTVKDLNKDDIVEIQFKDGNINTKVI